MHTPTFIGANGLARRSLDYCLLPAGHSNRITRQRVQLNGPLVSDHRLVLIDYVHKWKNTTVKIGRSEIAPLKRCFSSLAYDASARRTFTEAFDALPYPTNPLDFQALIGRVYDAASVLHEVTLPELDPTFANERVLMFDLRMHRRPSAALLEQLHLAHHNESNRLVTDMVDQYASHLRDRPWLAWKHVFEARIDSARLPSAVPPRSFYDHFSKLMHAPLGPLPEYTPPPPLPEPPPPMDDGPFTIPEMEEAADAMANHKAMGPDYLPCEIFKCHAILHAFLPLVNHIYTQCEIPPDVCEAWLTPVFKKKGDSSDAANYRPLVLLSHLLKLIDKMILNRIRKAPPPHSTSVSTRTFYDPQHPRRSAAHVEV